MFSELQGGKFGHGFASAGFTKAFAPWIGKIETGGDVDVGQVFAAAIVGGTASELSGGKFANGAITAAMLNIYNAQRIPQSGGYKKEFGTLEEAIAAAAVDITTSQRLAYDLYKVDVKFGTFITYEDMRTLKQIIFMEPERFAYIYEKPTEIMAYGRRHNSSELMSGEWVKESSVAWLVGIGPKIGNYRTKRIAVPNVNHFTAHPWRKTGIPGYLIQDSSTIRKFNTSRSCTTYSGKSTAGCP